MFLAVLYTVQRRVDSTTGDQQLTDEQTRRSSVTDDCSGFELAQVSEILAVDTLRLWRLVVLAQ